MPHPQVGGALAKLLGQPREATLADGSKIRVRPFTLAEFDEMDQLEPGDLTPTQYMSLRLYMLLRTTPGYEVESYDAWRSIFDGAAYDALRPVADLIEVVTQPFRHRQPAGAAGGPTPPHAG